MQAALTDEAKIVELLRTLPDAREALGRGDITSDLGDRSKLLHMPPIYHEGSYRQLEDALLSMRKQGRQQAVSGIPLATLYWHLSARYLHSERRTTEVWEKREGRNGKKHSVKVRTVVYAEPREYAAISADRRKLCHRLGVEWLAREFRRLKIEPNLPQEIFDLVAA